MLRAEFDHTLREAQAGDAAAFVRLWRDANPRLVRYLRVAGAVDPCEVSLDAWSRVVRGLRSFTGDEIAWRGWLFGFARELVDEGTGRRGRGSALHRASRGRGRPAGAEELSVSAGIEPAELRGVNDTIAAIRELPLGQGEILMLRLSGELPVSKVADLVGTDVIDVRRSEDGAVERLGAERELIAWSLAAPALPEELAGQHRALALFRGRRDARTFAVGGDRGATPVPAKRPTVVRSRFAVLCIAAVSASAMSVGGLSAAAYVGILPDGLQQVMHHAIGAPDVRAPRRPSGLSSPTPPPPTGGASTAARTAGVPDAPPTSVQQPRPSTSGPGAASHGTLPTATPRVGGLPFTTAPVGRRTVSQPTTNPSSGARPQGQPTRSPSGVAMPPTSQAPSTRPVRSAASHTVSPTTPPRPAQTPTAVATASGRR